MEPKRRSADEVAARLATQVRVVLNQWLADGKVVAVYQCNEAGHPQVGDRKYVTYTATLKPWADEPFGYTLIGI